MIDFVPTCFPIFETFLGFSLFYIKNLKSHSSQNSFSRITNSHNLASSGLGGLFNSATIVFTIIMKFFKLNSPQLTKDDLKFRIWYLLLGFVECFVFKYRQFYSLKGCLNEFFLFLNSTIFIWYQKSHKDKHKVSYY